MKRKISSGVWFFIFLISLMNFTTVVRSQSYSFDWTGTELVPKTTFLTPSNWTTNVPNIGLGDKSQVTTSGDTLNLNWTFGTGNRGKWSQCYLYFQQPISLADYDLFSFNLKGMPTQGIVGFELKFEDGTHQAVVGWDGLAGLNRWAEKISASKKQFSNASTMDWSKVKVMSLAVYAQASAQYTYSEHGTLCIQNPVGAKMTDWQRGTMREFINPSDYSTVKDKALNAIVSRQKSTGLLTTWEEDGSSWLYGQGLALKALSLDGIWNQGSPVNASAIAAEKLAMFLLNHQQAEGYWPRAWNSETGAILVLREADGTVWMGDFPWIITGLQAYYKKSGDLRVQPAVKKGLDFLKNLIDQDGKLYTENPISGIKTEVTSCEAYAAAMLSLYESGETTLSDNLYNYIYAHGWDATLRCWREATNSDRMVLFANTWMSYYLFQKGETQAGLDALSLIGKVLYTNGNGEMHGMDGIVPLAIWFEGTLTYIADGGPGSITLFDELKTHIQSDGMVPHYNENLGGIGGIWAVDWHSLDGTSWLYFTSAGKSPFDLADGIPVSVDSYPAVQKEGNFRVTVPLSGELLVTTLNPLKKDIKVRVVAMDGRTLLTSGMKANSKELTIKLPLDNLIGKVVLVQVISSESIESYQILLY